MPLERFADSNAIQLINQHATVPRRSDAGAAGRPTAPPPPAATRPPVAAPQALPPTSRGAAPARRRRSVEPAAMSWTELHQTLAGARRQPSSLRRLRLRVDRAELTVPLEATIGDAPDGSSSLGGCRTPAGSSGFLPPVHLSHLVIEPSLAGARRGR